MRGPTPEGLAFRRGCKAVEKLGILAHDEVGEERDLGAFGGQVAEGRHRNVDFVADAADVNEDLRRGLFNELAVQPSDHDVFPSFVKSAVQALRAPAALRPRRGVA